MKKKHLFLTFLMLLVMQVGWGQTTVIDFETAGDGYTSSSTAGSSFEDVFNRINDDICDNEDGYYWAIEDNPTGTSSSITLDQIIVTGASSFTFSVDLLAHHFNDWDNDDELLITYSVDGGGYQNLMSVQNNGATYNQAASLDTDFDGDGDCGTGVLPALTTGTSGCTVPSGDDDFRTFSTSSIPLSGNSTLDIKLQFNGLDAADEGLYIDNITITQTVACTTPTISTVTPTNPTCGATGSIAITSSGDVTDYSIDNGATWTANATNSYTFNTLVAGTYNVQVRNTAACVATYTSNPVTLTGNTVSETPVLDEPICAGETSVSGTSNEANGSTVTVYVDGSPEGTTTVISSNSWTVSGLTALTGGEEITATVQASGECLSNSSSSVTVGALPGVPSCSTPSAVCEGTAVTITGAGSTNATSYTYWDANSGGTKYQDGVGGYTVSSTDLTTPNNLSAGTHSYYVQGENACGVSNRQQVDVEINAVPATPGGTISAVDNPACGSTTISYAPTPSASTIYWQGTNASGTSSAAGDDVASNTYNVSATGTYYARAYNGSCWSTGSASLAVTVNTAPSISVQPTNQTVTTPNTATFDVTASDGTGYQWQINTGSGWANVSTGSGGTTSSYTTEATTTDMDGYQYRVIITADAPCSNLTSDEVTLNANSGPLTTFTFPFSNSLAPTLVGANTSISNMALSAGTIETGQTTGSDFPNEPFVAETGGWAATSQATAKYFYFTITPDAGYDLEITGISFRAYSTSSGPSAFSYDINNGGATYTTNAPDGSLVYVDQAVSLTGLSGAITIKIQGWDNGSRSTGGTGVFRLDDVTIQGKCVSSSIVLNLSPTSITGLDYNLGSGPSSDDLFSVTGTGFDGSSDVTITCPDNNFEVSLDGTNYFSSRTLSSYDGSEEIISVRLKAGLSAGDYTESIEVSGGGAATKTIDVSGTVIKPEPTNQPTDFACSTTGQTTMDLTWTDAVGAVIPDGYLIKWSTVSYAAIVAPEDGTAEANSSTVQNVTAGTESYNVTGLTAGTTYYYQIWSYTNSGSNINYNLVSPGQTSCQTYNAPCNTNDFDGGDWTIPGGLAYISNNSSFDNDAVNANGWYGALNDVNDVILSPELTSPATLIFWGSTNAGASEAYTIKVQKSTNGTDWTDVASYSDINFADSPSYTETSLSLGLIGNNYLRFIMTSETGTVDFRLDDITVFCSGATPNVAITTPAISAGNVEQNTDNHILYNFTVSPTLAGVEVDDVDFDLSGSYTKNSLKTDPFKLWYSTTNDFGTAYQMSAPVASTASTSGDGETISFTGLGRSIAQNGTGYFWLTADFECEAVIGRNISVDAAENADFTFSSAVNITTGPTYTAGGLQTITGITGNEVTGASGTDGQNQQVPISWTNPDCFTAIMIVASEDGTFGTPSGTYSYNSLSFTDVSNDVINDGVDDDVVVYYSSFPSSPKTVTYLTNGHTYSFKIFVLNGNSWSSGVVVTGTPGTSCTQTVTSFYPTSGPIGTEVLINGTGFNSGTTVEVNGTAATTEFIDANTLRIEIPSGATTGKLQITVNGCDYLTVDNFEVIERLENCMPPTTDLLISELYDAQDGSLGFIELYNGTSGDVVLTDYSIKRYNDANTLTHTYSFPSGTTITSGSVIIGRVSETATGISYDFTFEGSTSGFNEDDRLELWSSTAEIDEVVAQNVNVGYSYFRNENVTAPNTTFDSDEWTYSSSESSTDLGTFAEGEIITIDPDPIDVEGCNMEMTITATTTGDPLSYQWVYNNGVDETGWTNVTTFANTTVTGASSNTLDISGDLSGIDGYQFYVIVTGSCTARSNAAQFDYASTLPLYRSTATGSWNVASNWEMSQDGTLWSEACDYPTAANSDEITILNGHTITCPDKASSVTFTADLLTVESGGVLQLDPESELSVTNLVNNGTSASIVIKSDATGTGSLIQENGTVPATVERYLTADKWQLIFSPLSAVDGASILQGSGEYGYWYDETKTDYWNATTVFGDGGTSEIGWQSGIHNTMLLDRGYIHKGENNTIYSLTGGNLTADEKDFTLSYTQNSGTVTVPDYAGGGTNPIAYTEFDGWNLIGNPYASAISWDDVTLSNVEDFVYFYNGSTYQCYGTSPYNQGITVNTAAKFIPAGQGFFVKAEYQADPVANPQTVTIPKTARVHNSQTFYKSPTELPNNVVKFNVSQGDFTDESIIRTLPTESGVTESHDAEYDAHKMFSWENGNPQIYSTSVDKTERYAINSLPEVQEHTIVPIGLYVPQNGQFEINFMNNTFENVHVWLEDVVDNKTITVSDNTNYTFNCEQSNSKDRFYLHLGINHAPVATTVDNIEIYEDENFSEIFDNIFTDEDLGDELTVEFTELPEWLEINETTLNGLPTNDEVGVHNVTMKGTDKFGAFAEVNFTITVLNVNDAPVANATIDAQIINEDSEFTLEVEENTFTDIDAGDVLTITSELVTGESLPTWLSFDANTQTYSGTPENEDVGTYNVRLTATDIAGESASIDFELEVLNVNDAPIATSIDNQTANEDAEFTFAVAENTFYDVDIDDVLTYISELTNGESLPTWLSFDANNQTYSGLPENEDVGNYNIRITATDIAGENASIDFVLEVVNTNDAPWLSVMLPDDATYTNELWSYTFAENVFIDIDLDDELSYSASLSDESELPTWLSFSGAERTFEGTPLEAQELEIMVTATDNFGASVFDIFTLGVLSHVGVEESDNLNVNLYPNPSTGLVNVNISNINEVSTIKVISVTGRTLLKTQSTEEITEIDLTQYENGIYFIEITNSQINEIRKIVLRK